MRFEELRSRHPAIVFRDWKVQIKDSCAAAEFELLLEPDIVFRPTLLIEGVDSADSRLLERFFFHIGLIELVSYWKCACPAEIRIEAGPLSEPQIDWWKDLYLQGLGEFFYRSGIDFTAPDLLHLRAASEPAAEPAAVQADRHYDGCLIMTAGGKDSTVALELLKDLPMRRRPLMLNPTRAALESARLAGYEPPVVISRTIDPALLELNALGYLNGHTPFSAYLAFAGVLAAELFGFRWIVAANERSSDEPNVFFRGRGINHQYSKSSRFEQRFREYSAEFLSPAIEYFSFLRPLYDLQIAGLFSRYPHHFRSFRSCNAAQKRDGWCGRCPKCAFVALSLAPFLEPAVLCGIFGADVFMEPAIRQHIRALTGLESHKPFECVGTEAESQAACRLAARRSDGGPPFLRAIAGELPGGEDDEALLRSFSGNHFLPPEFEAVLRASAGDIRCE